MYIDKLNQQIENAQSTEDYEQIEELILGLYGDGPYPPELRVFYTYDDQLGDTIEDKLTQEEAKTLHHRDLRYEPSSDMFEPDDITGEISKGYGYTWIAYDPDAQNVPDNVYESVLNERLADDQTLPEDAWESQYEEEDPDEGDFRLAMQNALDRLPEEKIMEILEEFGFGADEYHWGNK